MEETIKKRFQFLKSCLMLQPIRHLVQIFEWFIGTIVSLFAVWPDSWTDGKYVIYICGWVGIYDLFLSKHSGPGI